MLRVKGVYDGQNVVLLEPVSMAPNTAVEVLVPEQDEDKEQAYWQLLLDQGLIKEVRPRPVDETPFTPVQVTGEPLSQTIIDERR